MAHETEMAGLREELNEKEKRIRILEEERSRRESFLRTLKLEFDKEHKRLQREVATKDQDNESLRRHVSNLEATLARIQGSMGWKILNLYGPIKYRYLLPIYRRLHKSADRLQDLNRRER